ncbi:uncharacterized protein QYS62_011547 [Fusarium acuminatum]|uniref:Uncharacterized protein n=1 Tax=Fusarium acuminatum TaxID=5515 RepID=A0ABZ2XEL1_9HYPO
MRVNGQVTARLCKSVGKSVGDSNTWQGIDNTRKWNVTLGTEDVEQFLSDPEGHCEKILQSAETIVGRLRAAPDSVKNIAQQLFSEECEHLKKQSSERSLGDGVLAKELLTKWMRRTRWQETFGRTRHDILIFVTFLKRP